MAPYSQNLYVTVYKTCDKRLNLVFFFCYIHVTDNHRCLTQVQFMHCFLVMLPDTHTHMRILRGVTICTFML
jgi:hypothetical protein